MKRRNLSTRPLIADKIIHVLIVWVICALLFLFSGALIAKPMNDGFNQDLKALMPKSHGLTFDSAPPSASKKPLYISPHGIEVPFMKHFLFAMKMHHDVHRGPQGSVGFHIRFSID